MTLYTDGSCLNGVHGGWAYALIEDEELTWSDCGGVEETTNNRMELMAVIEALKRVNRDPQVGVTSSLSHVTIYTDSKLTIKCATGEWRRKKNLDLWREYDIVSKGMQVSFEWVKGHSGDRYNEIVDQLARSQAELIRRANRTDRNS